MSFTTTRPRLAAVMGALTIALALLVTIAGPPAPAEAAAGTFRLSAGEELTAGQSLVSPDGRQVLAMQTDGNLVLYGPDGSRWETDTDGRGGVRLAMQTDGNLVMYDATNYPVWHTNTRGSGADHLDMQSDGNVVLYTKSNGVPWQTNTRYQPSKLVAPAGLRAGEVLRSPSGAYTLSMQTDGNLVLYGPSGWTWQTNTAGSGAVRLAVQADGNLVLYTASDYPAWIAGTRGSGLVELRLQDDGNLVGYRADGSWAWQTYTYPGGQAPGTPAPTPANCGAVTGPVPASSTTVASGIRVHACLTANLDRLLADARAAGVALSGSGWRDQQTQIQLRISNCGGNTTYNIWSKPSSQCSPPTAIPGRSMHERGLAIDFTTPNGDGKYVAVWSGSPAFTWLKGNAARYGLSNLPSEAWHWSTNGS